MPHLLMSNDESDTAATPAESGSTVLQFPRLGHTKHRSVRPRPRHFRGADPDLEPLRRQATSIIDEVLAGTDPEEADVREKLQWHVANNPGQPEKALLEHLRTVADQQASA
jgi:hypothetical protein